MSGFELTLSNLISNTQMVMLALFFLLFLLVLVFFLIKKKTKIKSKKIILTQEFKDAVKNVDLNLSEDHKTNEVLIEKEEILLALRELYDHEFISQEEFKARTEKIVNEVKSFV